MHVVVNDGGNAAAILLVGAYWFFASILAAFGLYYVVTVALRFSLPPKHPAPMATARPYVTIQVPVRNERYVIVRALEAIGGISWPPDRLEVQVLDDSDDATTELAADAIQRLRTRGLEAHHVRRADPAGFKAGALNHGLETARGDVIAIFDADFVPPADFLLRTIPFLHDADVACVQTRWAHLNENTSWLTRSVASALDAHFAVEQEVRGRLGLVMSFNATSCVWKRSALAAAGGWPTTTLTEDLDLTLRVLSLGLRFEYLDEPRVPCEVPAEVLGFAKQQARWARGGAQNLGRHAVPILRTKRLRAGVRLDALFHLFHYGFQPALVGLFLCSLGFAFLDVGVDLPGSLAVGVVAALGPLVLLVDGQRRSHPEGWRGRLWRIIPLTLVGMGICLRVAAAFIAGLFPGKGSFARTPKFALEGRQGTWHGLAYVPRPDLVTVAEAASALLAGWGAWSAFRMERYGLGLSLAVFGAAFALVVAYSMMERLFGRSSASMS